MFLYPLNDDWTPNTPWCGPTALSFLTNTPLSQAHSAFAFIQNKALDTVDGVYTGDLICALRERGRVAVPYQTSAKTLIAATRELSQQPFPYLLNVTRHFVCGHSTWLADNWTLRPVPMDRFPKPTRRLVEAYTIRPLN